MASKFYSGTGCHVHNDCLTCPLERCIYDRVVVREYTLATTDHRRKRIRELRQSGFTVVEVADVIGVSRRTVMRLSVS